MRKDHRLFTQGIALDSGQLWRRTASGETHKVVSVHGGQVLTRSVEGGFQGLEGDFAEQFERIITQAEKTAAQPNSIARRKGMVPR
jgi:hypothetical protein